MLTQEECIKEDLQSWEKLLIWLQESDLSEKGMYAFWLLWHNKNDCLHNMKCRNPYTLRLMAFKSANDYIEASIVASTAIQRNREDWIPLPRCYYKINVDATYNA